MYVVSMSRVREAPRKHAHSVSSRQLGLRDLDSGMTCQID